MKHLAYIFGNNRKLQTSSRHDRDNPRKYEKATSYIDKTDEFRTAKRTLFSALEHLLCRIESMIKEIEADRP